jgi:hypothetical protein
LKLIEASCDVTGAKMEQDNRYLNKKKFDQKKKGGKKNQTGAI